MAAQEENPAAGAEVADFLPARRGLVGRAWDAFTGAVRWVFGLVTLVVGLAVLSVVPVLNVLSLGYLLEASGSVARTGRLRDGFIGVHKAAILGSIILGTWLVLWPVRLAAGFWEDAELIAPGSANARNWRLGFAIIAALTLWHIVWACVRGGKLRHFLWPRPIQFFKWISRQDKYATLRNDVLEYLAGLRLPHYFWLGLRGFVGAVAWLLAPVGILILASKLPTGAGILLSLPGMFLMFLVVIHLPFLQAHFAGTNRFTALFEVREVRRMFQRAPVAWWVALLVTLLFALPLYLLKVELTPRDLAWLPSLFFVAFIFPARLLTGWAVGRALRREEPRHWCFRWLSRLAILPVAGFYVLFVYFTQYYAWSGSLSLLEQHAFLVPAPLIGL
ncbi:MAG: hypothetical protein AB1705_05960 [Verrucomicrobiota bacterium]